MILQKPNGAAKTKKHLGHLGTLQGIVNKLMPQNQRQALGTVEVLEKPVSTFTKSKACSWTLDGFLKAVNTFMLQSQKQAPGTFERLAKRVKQKNQHMPQNQNKESHFTESTQNEIYRESFWRLHITSDDF